MVGPHRGCLRQAADFWRQRPALPGKPAWNTQAVPVDAERTCSAQLAALLNAPAISHDVVSAVRIDQREIGPPRVGKEPDRVGAAAAPVIHRTEPFVLRGWFDDTQRSSVGRLQRTPDCVVAVDRRWWLRSATLNRIGDGAKRRMRLAPVG